MDPGLGQEGGCWRRDKAGPHFHPKESVPEPGSDPTLSDVGMGEMCPLSQGSVPLWA